MASRWFSGGNKKWYRDLHAHIAHRGGRLEKINPKTTDFNRTGARLKYLIVAILVAAVLYIEVFVYHLQSLYWHKLQCYDEDPSCIKILFVADPQIQGDLAVPPPLSYLFNWDSDKYLKHTFSVVYWYYQPDIIVYLGDLMDEGSVSTTVQFNNYVDRLRNIFYTADNVMHIWLPGDNDIGGEGFEPIQWNKLKEFNKVFNQAAVIQYGNISFYKVNGITHKYPEAVVNGTFKIVLSHYPLTMRPTFGQLVNNAICPDIYFCAHDHGSKFTVIDKHFTFRDTYPLVYPHEILEVSFADKKDDRLYEIYVPTCSYRMGNNRIGFGAAIMDHNNQQMRYTVFWSPRRFPFLFFYLVLLIVFIIYVCVFGISKVCSSKTNRTRCC